MSPRRDALVLAVSVFLASPGLAIVAPLMAPIRDEFGVGNFEAGLSAASSPIGSGGARSSSPASPSCS